MAALPCERDDAEVPGLTVVRKVLLEVLKGPVVVLLVEADGAEEAGGRAGAPGSGIGVDDAVELVGGLSKEAGAQRLGGHGKERAGLFGGAALGPHDHEHDSRSDHEHGHADQDLVEVLLDELRALLGGVHKGVVLQGLLGDARSLAQRAPPW